MCDGNMGYMTAWGCYAACVMLRISRELLGGSASYSCTIPVFDHNCMEPQARPRVTLRYMFIRDVALSCWKELLL